MGKRFFLGLLILLAACCLKPVFLSAEDINVSTTFDKRSAQVGEEIHMTIRVAGAQGNIQAPRLPAFKGFDTFYTGRASQLTFINGQSSSNVEFSYVLVPRDPGKYTLSGIEVSVNDRRFATTPIDIEVTPGSGVAAQQGAANPQSGYFPPRQGGAAPPLQQQQGPVQDEPPAVFQPNDDNIFVRAWADKNSVYPNEQVLLTYDLYTRYDTRYEGFDKEPQVSGFWIEEFPMDKEVPRETVRMNGKRYVKAEVRKMALFPTASAEYTIDPGTMKASIRQEPESTSVFDEFFNDSFFSGGSFFARRENRILKPPPISIHVKPLPENGKPASFQGAVGNFRLTATVDKTTVKQNEPVTMTLVIEGEGNIETLNKPKIPELPDFKVYDSDSSSQLFKTGNVIGGRKTFEVVFIPTDSGQKKIPKLEFSYFNPSSASYIRLSTPEYQLAVTPSDQAFKLPSALSQQAELKKQIEVESKDIRYIWENLPEQKKETAFRSFFSALAGGNILMTLLTLFGIFRAREQSLFASNNALRRRKFARSMAEGRIRHLKKHVKSPDLTAYFEAVEKILTQYLADKFDFSAQGATRYDLELHLARILGQDDPLAQELMELYRFCDESRFGKASVPEELRTKALKILRDTIARVEKMKR